MFFTLAYVACIAIMWTWGHTSLRGWPEALLSPPNALPPFSDCDQAHFCPHPALASPWGHSWASCHHLPATPGARVKVCKS